MKVSELIKKLEELDQDIEVVIDVDENGWWGVEDVTTVKEGGNIIFANIVSSNES